MVTIKKLFRFSIFFCSKLGEKSLELVYSFIAEEISSGSFSIFFFNSLSTGSYWIPFEEVFESSEFTEFLCNDKVFAKYWPRRTWFSRSSDLFLSGFYKKNRSSFFSEFFIIFITKLYTLQLLK